MIHSFILYILYIYTFIFIYLLIYLFSYKPKCEFGCGQKGQCINNDLCDCGDSNFKGKYCNEYIMLGRNTSLDFVFIVMTLIILFIIIVSIGMTVYYRNNPIIKGGNNEINIIQIFNLTFFYSNII